MPSKPPQRAFGEGDIQKISMDHVAIFLAAVGSGIVGGIFYAFSSFVMAALARIPAAQGVAVMNSISVTVINPSSMIPFLGTAIMCLLVSIGSVFLWNQPGTKLALAASAVCLVGCI